MRVVSLLPSATEITAALGHAGDLVGRSAECDYPPEVRGLPVVMRPRVDDFHRPSREIDLRVREARRANESLYALDVPLLRRVRPDVVLTQDLCGVCSVTGDEVQSACKEAGIQPTIVSLTPTTLEEVWTSIEAVGTALRAGSAAGRLAQELRRRSAPDARGRRSTRVAVVEWLDPPIVAGLWVPEMIATAGGVAVGNEAGKPAVTTSWEAIRGLRPDLMLLAPCSFSVDRTRQEIETAGLRGLLQSMECALGVWVVDEAYFSRPGPRLADGVDLIRSILYSEPYVPPMPASPFAPMAA